MSNANAQLPASRWYRSTLVPFVGITTCTALLCYYSISSRLEAQNRAMGALLKSQATETADLKAALVAGAEATRALAETNRIALEKAVQVNREAVEQAVRAAAANQETIRQQALADFAEDERKRDESRNAMVVHVDQIQTDVEQNLAETKRLAALTNANIGSSRAAAERAAQSAAKALATTQHTASVIASKVATTGDKKTLDRQQAKATALAVKLQTRVRQYQEARRKLENR